MTTAFLSLYLLQGVVLFFDEWVFHQRRGLPKWELWGHPLDTAVFLAALSSLWGWGPGWISITLSVLSCLVITKDEGVHVRENCTALEHWLHSLLFILHPSVLIFAHLVSNFSALYLIPPGLVLIYQLIQGGLRARSSS